MDQVVRSFLAIFCFIFGVLASDFGDDGIFTSSTDLEKLLSTEAEVVKALKDYVKGK